MAVESDAKKDALLEELKVATKESRGKLEVERDTLTKELAAFDIQKKLVKEE